MYKQAYMRLVLFRLHFWLHMRGQTRRLEDVIWFRVSARLGEYLQINMTMRGLIKKELREFSHFSRKLTFRSFWLLEVRLQMEKLNVHNSIKYEFMEK